MFQKNENGLAVPTINQFLRLALAPPDEALLRRYFAACESDGIESPLTDAERRWATVNLDANSSWQQKWRELEKEFGKPVDWRVYTLFPRPTAKHQPRFNWRAVGEFFDLWQPAWAFRFAAAAIIFAALYGTLWVAGKARLSETYQLASIAEYQDELAAGIRGESSVSSREFSTGAAALLAAPQDWLGLFPHYDLAQANEAIKNFLAAFQNARDAFQRAEIAFFLAKAYLMQDEVSRAKHWLEQALAQNVADYREEASAMLQKL